jgi:microcystin degradation protein MlrC
VDLDGVEVIVTSQRMAPNDPEIFRHIGIEPTGKHILVVKSRGHFRAAYEPFAAEILEVDCPGFASPNLRHFAYHKVRRPLFPLDDLGD